MASPIRSPSRRCVAHRAAPAAVASPIGPPQQPWRWPTAAPAAVRAAPAAVASPITYSLLPEGHQDRTVSQQSKHSKLVFNQSAKHFYNSSTPSFSPEIETVFASSSRKGIVFPAQKGALCNKSFCIQRHIDISLPIPPKLMADNIHVGFLVS